MSAFKKPANPAHLPMTNLRIGLSTLIAAVLVLGSFLLPWTHSAWLWLDQQVFYWLNGTVAWGSPWVEIWAATGDRRFDLFTGVIIIGLFYWFWLWGDEHQFRNGVAVFFYLAVVLFLVVTYQREILQMPSPSPSLLYEPFYSIKDQVPWSRAKETTLTGFPSDHATFMFLITWLWWHAGGRRIGLLALGLTFLFALPRLGAGAHGISDTLVGGTFSALAAASIAHLTPAGRWLAAGSYWAADQVMAIRALFLRWWRRTEYPQEAAIQQVLRGACIGTADLIPGVSGGTMAFILRIYDRLLSAISHVDKHLLHLLRHGQLNAALRHLDVLFLVPLGLGIIAAIAFFSRVIPISWLIRELPEATFGLFFGLIAASIVSLLLGLKEKRPLPYLWWLAGLALGLLIVNLVPVQTPSNAGFVFFSGAIAAVAMLLPGISGSFILLLLGKYADMLDALGTLDMSFLLPLIAGILTGILIFARIIHWLLRRFHLPTMMTVIGILTGSILAVWPLQHWLYVEVGGKLRLQDAVPYWPQSLDLKTLTALVMVIVGVLLYRWLERLAGKSTI